VKYCEQRLALAIAIEQLGGMREQDKRGEKQPQEIEIIATIGMHDAHSATVPLRPVPLPTGRRSIPTAGLTYIRGIMLHFVTAMFYPKIRTLCIFDDSEGSKCL
jgi:hypothetical protein